jgi:hypothetical protein
MGDGLKLPDELVMVNQFKQAWHREKFSVLLKIDTAQPMSTEAIYKIRAAVIALHAVMAEIT